MTESQRLTVQHTPGPWEAVDHYSDSVVVTDSRGFQIVEAKHVAILLDYHGKLGIPHWADSPEAACDLSAEEQAANARLIAAAPELLAATQLCLDALTGNQLGCTQFESLLKAARAAIAKATGSTK